MYSTRENRKKGQKGKERKKERKKEERKKERKKKERKKEDIDRERFLFSQRSSENPSLARHDVQPFPVRYMQRGNLRIFRKRGILQICDPNVFLSFADLKLSFRDRVVQYFL